MNAASLGQIVRKERKAQRLRQDELAAATGVGIRFLSELERGKPSVQLEKALAVLSSLGCRVSVQLPENDPPFVGQS